MKAQGTVKRIARTRPMATWSLEKLLEEITRLKVEVKDWRYQYQAERKLNQEMALRCRVLPSSLHGRRGELLIADVSQGALMDYAAKFDVHTPEKAKVEVKVSYPHDRSNNEYSESRVNYAKTFNWLWSNVLGSEVNPKKYDFLVLIGVMPEAKWHDGAPELVYFFVHISEVEALTIKSSGRRAIQLGTNPQRGWSVAKPLFNHRVTLAELESAIREG